MNREGGHPVEAREGEVWVWAPNNSESYRIVRIVEAADDHPDVLAETLAHADGERVGNVTSMAESNLIVRVSEGDES